MKICLYVNRKLNKIGVKKEYLHMMKKYLNENEAKEYFISDSHKYAYDFIEKIIKENTPIKVEITNIDFHHDIYNVAMEDVNCGNWLLKLMMKYNNIRINWICQIDSDTNDLIENVKISKTYTDAFKKHYDYVFICRSGMWSPPHLDKYFIKTFEHIIKDSYTTMQNGIFEDRYNEKFIELVNQQIKMRNEFIQNIRRK